MVNNVSLVAHADWSVSAGKRWMALSVRQNDGSFLAQQPELVGATNTLLTSLLYKAGDGGCVLVGFDFPIGLPLEYARRAGISDFMYFLSEAGQGRWADFYSPAEKAEEIRLERPFYPKKPGQSRREHLLKGLGIQSMQALMRRCEKAHDHRRAACPLFWTLGGQQVGKAAMCGWHEVLAPGLINDKLDLEIWPFSGRLTNLLVPGTIVAAETYPGEYYHQLGISFSNPQNGRKSGKRDQMARMNNRETLLSFAERKEIRLSPGLREDIQNGFGAKSDGEDRFDAVIGLFGMLHTCDMECPPEPDSDAVGKIEGWIFGQKWAQ